MKKPDLSYPGDDAVRRILARYRCPTAFHVVRSRPIIARLRSRSCHTSGVEF